MTASRAAAATDFTLPGNIQAIQDVPIYARADGYLKRRLVDIGDRVQQGQVLAEIDTPELDQQVAQGQAALAQAQASLAQAQSALEQARAALQHSEATMRLNGVTLARWQELKRRDLVAQQDVDNFQAASDGSRADVAAAQANIAALVASANAARVNVTASEADLRRLTDLQSYQTLRAPFSGVILTRQTELGEVMQPGTPVVTLADLDHVWLRAYVAETDLGRIRWGQAATVHTDTYPGRAYPGQISFIASEAEFTPKSVETHKERVTLVYRIKIDVINPNHELKPGMPADATIQLGPPVQSGNSRG